MSKTQNDIVRLLRQPDYVLLQQITYDDKPGRFYLKGPGWQECVPCRTARALLHKYEFEYKQSTNWKVWTIKRSNRKRRIANYSGQQS